MPGSGKSTLGKQLAEELKVRFVDLDAEIERSEQKSIPEIFELHGEDYFREAESHSLKNVALGSGMGFVMATGGGTPCFFDNLSRMNESGVTIFLDVSLDTLIQRLLESDLSSRPKFGDRQGLSDRLIRMTNERKSFYTKATLVLKGDDIQLDDLLGVMKSI